MSQIKKKFIADRAVDGSKILLLNNQSIKALIDNGETEQELFKFSGGNKFEFLSAPTIGGYAVDADQLVNKQFVDREVSAEETRAEAAESALSSRLSTIEGADSVPGSVAKSLKDSKSYTDSAITSLINGAPGMLDTLKEIADAIEADESVGAALASTVASNLQEAKDYTDTEVSTERSRAMGVESSLASDMADEEGRAMSEEARIEGKVDQEISDRQSAISSEQSARQSAISAEQSAREAAVSAEESRAEGEEARIEGLVTTEVARALAAEGVLSSAISAETSRAQGQEAAIDTRFVNNEAAHSAEVARAMGEEERIEDKLDQEISDRQSAISSEQSARGTAVSSALAEAKSYTDAQILEEEELRDAEVTALSERLDIVEGEDSVEGSVAKAEKDAKEFASAEVLTEKNRAEAAESGLQSAINTEKGRVDAILSASDADKDSFAEIVQLINSVDTESDSAFASYVLSNNSALSQEVSDRQYAVSTEENRAEQEESRIEGLLTQEVSDRETAVSTARQAAIDGIQDEQTRAEAAEAGLQSLVDNLDSMLMEEVSNREGAISSLRTEVKDYTDEREDAIMLFVDEAVFAPQVIVNSQVSTELADHESRLDGLDTRVGAEELRAMDEELRIETLLSSEVSRAQAEEASLRSDMEQGFDSHSTVMTGLQAQISALDTSRQNAESALSGRLDVLEAVLPRKETMEVSAEQASQGHIDLSMEAKEHSVHMFVGPLYAVEGIDYSVSVEGGVTRITFMGQLASGGVSEITSGDQVQVKYMK
jgi:hypothetical protein